MIIFKYLKRYGEEIEKIISELKTKDEINRLTSEDVRTLFEKSDNYEEFINNLYSFMTRDVGYKFYIHNKKDIMNELNEINDLSFGAL